MSRSRSRSTQPPIVSQWLTANRCGRSIITLASAVRFRPCSYCSPFCSAKTYRRPRWQCFGRLGGVCASCNCVPCLGDFQAKYGRGFMPCMPRSAKKKVAFEFCRCFDLRFPYRTTECEHVFACAADTKGTFHYPLGIRATREGARNLARSILDRDFTCYPKLGRWRGIFRSREARLD